MSLTSETAGLTRKIVDFVLETEYRDLPKNVVDRAKIMILDNIGAQLAAASSPIGRIIKNYLQLQGGKRQCTVVGLGLKTSCVSAGWANATLGHGLDIDDGDRSGGAAHPTSKSLPAALCVGELERVAGPEMLAAFVLATEIQVRIGMAVQPSHFQLGWHGTGTYGAFGAVAAAGKLLDLSTEQMLNAFGIAGSVVSALKINMGTMVKPHHAGHAVEQGLKAAFLAKTGWKASERILEGEFGFLRVMSNEPSSKIASTFMHLGEPWCIQEPGIYFKAYPSCGYHQLDVQAAISMAKEHNIDPDQVESVEVGTDKGCIDRTVVIGGGKIARDAYEARFSIPAAVAIGLIRRAGGIDEFTDNIVQDPRTVELMKKVTLYLDPEIDKAGYNTPMRKLKIRLKNGSKYAQILDGSTRGLERVLGPTFVMSDEEVYAKFKSNAGRVLAGKTVDDLFRLVLSLDTIDDVSAITSLMAG